MFGILLGAVLSQAITAMLLHTYQQAYQFYVPVYPDTILLTIFFFVVAFFIVGLFHVRTIRKIKVIDMLQAAHKTEHELQKDKWIHIWIAIATIMAGLMFLNGSTIVEQSLFGTDSLFSYFDNRYAMPVKFVFYGNVVTPILFMAIVICYLILKRMRKRMPLSLLVTTLVLVSIPIICCSMSISGVASRYYIPLGNDMKSTYLIFGGFFLIFSICGFFYVINDGLRIIKNKSAKIRYKNDNLFLFGQITARLKTTSKTMAIICITLMVSGVLIILAPVFSSWIMGYLNTRALYDIQVFSSYNTVYDLEDLQKGDYNFIKEELVKTDMVVDESHTFYTYFLKADDFYNRIVYEFPALALSLSDYNRIRLMAGLNAIELDHNAFTTQWYATASEQEMNDFLIQNKQVEIGNEMLMQAASPVYQDNLGEYIYNDYTNVLFIFPDWICENLLKANYFYLANGNQTISYQDAIGFQEIVNGYVNELSDDTGIQLGVRLSTIQINEATSGAFLFRMIMMYTGIVLLIVCFTVLSIQQLSDATDFRYRFGVLKKMGVTDNRITHLIAKQMGVWFGLPIVIAAITVALLVKYFISSYEAELLTP